MPDRSTCSTRPTASSLVFQELGWYGVNAATCVPLLVLAFLAQLVFGGKAATIAGLIGMVIFAGNAARMTFKRLKAQFALSLLEAPAFQKHMASANICVPALLSFVTVQLGIVHGLYLMEDFGVAAPKLGLLSLDIVITSSHLAVMSLAMPVVIIVEALMLPWVLSVPRINP